MEDVTAPRWAVILAGAVTVLVPAGFGIAKLWFWLTKTKRTQDQADQDRDDERVAKVKREALAEAWGTVDRLTKINEAQEEELRESRDRINKCEADRAVLRLVVAWAKRKGMPMTPELDRLLEDTSDKSGPHTPLPPMEPHQ